MKIAKPMMLLPPKPELCQTCGFNHEPHNPHNPATLYYKTKFYMEKGRGPTWIDAMAHCPNNIKEYWTTALEKKGIDVKGGKLNPNES